MFLACHSVLFPEHFSPSMKNLEYSTSHIVPGGCIIHVFCKPLGRPKVSYSFNCIYVWWYFNNEWEWGWSSNVVFFWLFLEHFFFLYHWEKPFFFLVANENEYVIVNTFFLVHINALQSQYFLTFTVVYNKPTNWEPMFAPCMSHLLCIFTFQCWQCLPKNR